MSNNSDGVLLSRHLRRFDSVSKIRVLASKLFQKEPDLIRGLDQLVERVAKPYQLHESRSYVQQTILRVLSHPGTHSLPSHLEAYLAYMDLCWIGITHKTKWFTYKLQAFQVRSVVLKFNLDSLKLVVDTMRLRFM